MRSFVLAVVVMTATGAQAEEPASARSHWEEGTKLYDLGRYKEAAHEYEEAFRLKPDPAFLFNIGQAYRQAGENELALRAYRGFLRRLPESENRAEVEGYIRQVQARLDEAKRKAAEQPPQPQPQPQPTPAPAPAPAFAPPAPIVVAPTAPPAEHVPAYKKWWVWTIVGVVVVGGGAAALAVAYTTPKNAPSPSGTMTLVFP